MWLIESARTKRHYPRPWGAEVLIAQNGEMEVEDTYFADNVSHSSDDQSDESIRSNTEDYRTYQV